MERAEILAKLGEVFQMVMGAAADPEKYSEESSLTEDLGMNSVGILYTVIALEEVFSIRFDDVGTSELQTVGQVVDYIQKKVSG